MIISKYDLVAIVGTIITMLPLSYPFFQAAADLIVADPAHAVAPDSPGSTALRLNAATRLSTEAPSPSAPEPSDCPGAMGP